MISSPARDDLAEENLQFRGTGGVSAENADRGFRPAFCDTQTSRVYPSRFADGRAAPFHILDGLPDEVVAMRDAAGRVLKLKESLVSGFVRMGRFFTRDEASAAIVLPH